MTRNHLREVFFELGPVDLPRSSPNGPFTDEGRALASQLTTEIRRFAVLSTYIERELRKTKATVGLPPASVVVVSLESDAEPQAVRSDPPAETIELNFPYDPFDLLSVPKDRETLGGFHLGIARQTASYLRRIDGFPEGAWMEGCASYEENGFAIWLKAGERTVPGTRLKGQVAVEVAPDRTARWLILSHRGTTLARIELHSRPEGPDFATSKFFRGFELEGSILKLGTDPFAVEVPGRAPVWPAEQVDLRDYPVVFDLVVQKGWVSP